jgi:hypothetical protein
LLSQIILKIESVLQVATVLSNCTKDKKIFQSSNEEEAKYAKQNLRNVFLDLFFAGSETMSTTLRWAVLYMVIHPEVQVKIKVL